MHEIEVLFDGACPVCRREIALLRAIDRRGRIRFTDLVGMQPIEGGPSRAELMARIHARTPSGEWITGVEVFRRLYAAVGLGPLVGWTRVGVIDRALGRVYEVFARNRLRLTGRACEEGTCEVRPA